METSIWKRKINIFLLALPVVLLHREIGFDGLIEETFHLSPEPFLFVLAALALIPLAGFVESAVEELAELLGPFVGGLLHTTFTNVAELSIALSILLAFPPGKGSEIVLSSIAGVIIRNSLLFLGVATLSGCWKNGKMRFNAENAGEYSTVFALAVIGLSLPTLIAFILPAAESGASAAHTDALAAAVTPHAASEGGELLLFGAIPFSGVLAVVLLVSYLAYVAFAVFRFRAGHSLGGARGRQQAGEESSAFGPALALANQPDTQALFETERAQAEQRLHPKSQRAQERKRGAEGGAEEGEKDEDSTLAKVLRGLIAALILGLTTAGVFAMSEVFAHAAEELSANGPLHNYEFFLGLIVIPIVSGVVELYGSTGAARANRIELVMAITAGATIQMILLVVPVLVLVGLWFAHPLDLVFRPIEVIIFGATTFVFMLLSRDGESSILEGVQLVALWTLLGVTAFFLPPV